MNTTDHETAPAPIAHDFAAAARARKTSAVQRYRLALDDIERCLDPEVVERETGGTPHWLLRDFAEALCQLIAVEQTPLWGEAYIHPHDALKVLIDPSDPLTLRGSDRIEVPDPGPACPHCHL